MKIGVLKGQFVQRLGDESDLGRLNRRLGGWSRMSKGEHGRHGWRDRQGPGHVDPWVENFDF